MKVRSMRIPEDIEHALTYVSQSEKIVKTQSLRKVTRLGFEYYVTKSYREGRITLRDASKLLKLTLSETIDLLAEMGAKEIFVPVMFLQALIRSDRSNR